MSSNLQYLNFITNNNISQSQRQSSSQSSSQSYSQSYSQSTYQNNKLDKYFNRNKMGMTEFRNEFKDLLVKDYERPFIAELQRIRKSRGDDEYRANLLAIHKNFTKMREDSETSMTRIKQYLDYMDYIDNNESTNKNNKSRIYIPGLEGRIKLDEIILPDLLGFTSVTRPEKREEYSNFILKMIRNFLGFGNHTLTQSIRSLNEYILSTRQGIINSNEINMKFCEYFYENDFMKPLLYINSYYELFEMLHKGRFNLNTFMRMKSDSSKTTKLRKTDNNNDWKRLLSGGVGGLGLSSSLLKLGKLGKLSKGQSGLKKYLSGITGSTRSTLLNSNRRILSGEIDKKIKKMLEQEKISSLRNNNKRNTVNLEELKKLLQTSGIQIFKEKLEKNIDFVLPSCSNLTAGITKKDIIDKIYSTAKTGVAGATKVTIQDINNIFQCIKDSNSYFSKILEIGINYSGNNIITIKDFYTNKEREIKKGSNSNKNDTGLYKIVKNLYRGYYDYYTKYKLEYLPLSEDSKINKKKIAIRILNGLGVYLSVLREMLVLLIDKVLADEVMSKHQLIEKETNQKIKYINNRSEEKSRKNREYMEMMRLINKSIINEQDKNKLEELKKIKKQLLDNYNKM